VLHGAAARPRSPGIFRMPRRVVPCCIDGSTCHSIRLKFRAFEIKPRCSDIDTPCDTGPRREIVGYLRTCDVQG